MNLFTDIFLILPSSHKKKLPFLLLFVLLGTGMETLGLGAVLPSIALLSDDNFQIVSQHIPYITHFSHSFIIYSVLSILVFIYAFKTLYSFRQFDDQGPSDYCFPFASGDCQKIILFGDSGNCFRRRPG